MHYNAAGRVFDTSRPASSSGAAAHALIPAGSKSVRIRSVSIIILNMQAFYSSTHGSAWVHCMGTHGPIKHAPGLILNSILCKHLQTCSIHNRKGCVALPGPQHASMCMAPACTRAARTSTVLCSWVLSSQLAHLLESALQAQDIILDHLGSDGGIEDLLQLVKIGFDAWAGCVRAQQHPLLEC